MKKRACFAMTKLFLLAVLLVLPYSLRASNHIDMKAAQKEGKLMLYGSVSIEDITALAKAFEQKYPGFQVEVYRAGKIKLGERMITEARAGKHRFDVLLSSAFTTLAMKEYNLIGKYESPERVHYDSALTDPHGFWTAPRINPMTVGYNTKLVAKNKAPKQWEDLLAPEWKGKVAINRNRPEWYIVMLQMMGREKGRKYMQSLAALGTIPAQSATLSREFLAAGEYAVYANGTSGEMEEYKKKGAPVDWARLDVQPSYPILTSISAHTKSPNLARLMVDFLLSEDGQIAFRKLQNIPARKGVDPDPPYLVKGVKIFHVDINKLKGAEADQLEDEFRKTFGLR